MSVFKKTSRLLKKTDYDKVFAQANKVTTPEFIALFKKNQMGHARLGLVISKKKIPKAHDRNKVKRQIRECFRKEQLPEFDIVFLAKFDVSNIGNHNIRESLGKIWSRLNRY